MLRVSDIMTAEPLTVTPETTIREAMELLGHRHLSGAPVVSNGDLVGIVSATDLMTFVAEDVDTDEWHPLETHAVNEVMTRPPLVTLPPSARVEIAAELMHQNRIHRVLVTEGGRLVGVISASDIARAVADHRFHTHEYVFGRARVVWPMVPPQ